MSENDSSALVSSWTRWRPVLRWVFTALLLLVVFYLVDGEDLANQVRQFHLWPALLALLVSILQIVVSAWRWRYTAARLGLPLPLREAIREYYLASFLNQVLPGGVVGDANRAWRHGSSGVGRGAALRAVMIERLSGQLVLAVVALIAFLLVVDVEGLAQSAIDGIWQNRGSTVIGPVAVAVFGLVLGLGLYYGVRRGPPALLSTFAGDVRRALFVWPAVAWQWLSSILVLTTYLAVYLLAARALGVQRPAWELLPLVPLVLLAMLIPISVAGWGVREGAAALVWAQAGLPPAEGVVIAVGYGILVLISSLPGALMLATTRKSGQGLAQSRA